MLLERSQEKLVSQLQEETTVTLNGFNVQYREAKGLEVCLGWLKLYSLSKRQTVQNLMAITYTEALWEDTASTECSS